MNIIISNIECEDCIKDLENIQKVHQKDVKKLEKAINKLLKRHDALRTYFVVSDTELKQKILPKL